MLEYVNKRHLLDQGDGDFLPIGPLEITEWGRDHWSVLLYLADRCSNNEGRIKNNNMRCDPGIHAGFAHGEPLNRSPPENNRGTLHDASDEPTRLRDGSQVWCHDDWSCIQDMAAYGLVTVKSLTEREHRGHHLGVGIATVELSDEAWRLSEEARRFKARVGQLNEFEPSDTEDLEMDRERYEDVRERLKAVGRETGDE